MDKKMPTGPVKPDVLRARTNSSESMYWMLIQKQFHRHSSNAEAPQVSRFSAQYCAVANQSLYGMVNAISPCLVVRNLHNSSRERQNHFTLAHVALTWTREYR